MRTRKLLHERVLLKWPVFITRNKATASNPSCEGECCCWHGRRGAVRAPGRGGLRDLRGGQAAAANVIGSGPTQARGPSLTQGAYALESGKLESPTGLFGGGVASAALRSERGSSGSAHSSSSTKGFPELPWDAGAEPLPAPPRLTACKGQLPNSSPSREHCGAGTQGEPVCSYTQHPLLAPAHLTRYQGAGTRTQSQNRPFMILSISPFPGRTVSHPHPCFQGDQIFAPSWDYG